MIDMLKTQYIGLRTSTLNNRGTTGYIRAFNSREEAEEYYKKLIQSPGSQTAAWTIAETVCVVRLTPPPPPVPPAVEVVRCV